MNILEYKGFRVCRDSSPYAGQKSLEKPPYSFHLDKNRVLHIHRKIDDMVLQMAEHPIREINVSSKREIKSVINQCEGDLRSFLQPDSAAATS